MSEMNIEREHDGHAEADSSSSVESSAQNTIVIDVDRKLDERLGVLARWQGVTAEDLLADAIEQHPKHSEHRSFSIQVSEAAAARLAAAAATIGMSEEALIAEAIDTYTPGEKYPRFWPALGVPGVLVLLPVVLMFLSPDIRGAASAADWALFSTAMLACFGGAVVLVTAVIYAEWVVIKYGTLGLISQVACGAVAVLSVFAYVYWLLGSLAPGSFNFHLSRVDAIYFTLGTFTTTGTGRFAAQSSLAELLVCCQVVLGWGFVAILLALLVPRAAAVRKSRTYGRIVVRAGSSR